MNMSQEDRTTYHTFRVTVPALRNRSQLQTDLVEYCSPPKRGQKPNANFYFKALSNVVCQFESENAQNGKCTFRNESFYPQEDQPYTQFNIAASFTVPFHAERNSPWDEFLPILARRFCHETTLGFQPHQRPSLFLNGDIFANECLAISKEKKVNAIYVGNLINDGTMLVHWETSFLNRENLPDPTNWIYTTFEFDRKCFKIFFLAKDSYEERERLEHGGFRVKGYCDQLYTLKASFVHIRRILVDASAMSKGKQNVWRVHFDLTAPLEIRAKKIENEPGKKKTSFGDGQRAFRLKHGRRKGEYIEWRQWADSPSLTLEFPVCNDDDMQAMTSDPTHVTEMYQLLSRLYQLTRVPIQFVSVDMVDCILGRNKRYIWDMQVKERDRHKEQVEWREKGVKYTKEIEKSRPRPYKIRLNTPMMNSKGWDLDIKNFSNEEITDWIKKTRSTRQYKLNFPKEVKTVTLAFELIYMIEAILSRGARVHDQLLLTVEQWTRFIREVLREYRDQYKLCLMALERLLNFIDAQKSFGSLVDRFGKECKQLRDEKFVAPEAAQEGFVYLRKVVVTPTRVLYRPPETMMGNRVVRNHNGDGTFIIRVSFRDDNNTKMQSTNMTGDQIGQTVRQALLEGLIIGGRRYTYIGSSNSQMRDQGAYIYWEGNGKNTVADIRDELGDFEKLTIPKQMARIGQCFTQSQTSGVSLDSYIDYRFTYDITGGNNNKDEPFTFSDGVGGISMDQLKEIARQLHWGEQWIDRCQGPGLPSVIQFRFRGNKGVVAVNPLIDDIRRWSQKHVSEEERKAKKLAAHVWYRPSQEKFHTAAVVRKHKAKRYDENGVLIEEAPEVKSDCMFEMVKYSAPTPVNLNKPFINILDQVSEIQSVDGHTRMKNRIEELLDEHVSGISTTLVSERKCRNKLKELTRRVDVDILREQLGFNLCTEPFFRSLVKSAVKYTVCKSLQKMQIHIPHDMGRSMFGIVDETGQLQYGQIFVQYTVNIQDKIPRDTARREVLKGRVLITKNPCTVEGDVRMFEAVDIPELRHLVDCVVFPQHGPRPHPDEMAGSDLDGDEYSVVWDPALFLERNEPPFDYAAPTPPQRDKEVKTKDERMIEFYTNYLTQDSIGTLATAHLANSDQYGLTSLVCMNVAKKSTQAVDFPKTGVPPDELIKTWGRTDDYGEGAEEEEGEERKDEDRPYDLPPEKPERYPDYMERDSLPSYQSDRLLGTLFRDVRAIQDVMELSEEADTSKPIELDRSLILDGDDKYLDEARNIFDSYAGAFRGLLEQFGVMTEAELFSGYCSTIRNQINSREGDNMDMFSTVEIIQKKVSELFLDYRLRFFTFKEKDEKGEEIETCRYREYAEPRKGHCNEDNELDYVVSKDPGEEMKLKASAWYRACYQEYAQSDSSRQTRILSFAWLAFDVLAIIKETRLTELSDADIAKSSNPFHWTLQEHVKLYTDERMPEMIKTIEELNKVYALNCYLKQFKKADEETWQSDLARYMLCVISWGEKCKLFECKWKKEHLAMLFIQYGIGEYGMLEMTYMDKIDFTCTFNEEDNTIHDLTNLRTCQELHKPASFLLDFMHFLASRKFRAARMIGFGSMQANSVFMRGEWLSIHRAAVSSYYKWIFNMRFDELPLKSDDEAMARARPRKQEIPPFVIEWPANITPQKEEELCVKIKKHTGVDDLKLREHNRSGGKVGQRLVSAQGGLEELLRLKKLLAVRAPNSYLVPNKGFSEQMGQLVIEKIERL